MCVPDTILEDHPLMSLATMLRDVIEIPESVSANDYVLKLTDGVSHAEATIAQYVVTPELATNFSQALDLVRSALEKGRSDGAFLHGSFGSGKSHFMAVLHELLRHNPLARGLPGLEGIVAAHDSWLADRKVLTLTYHLIGAESLERALLGGYLEQVRRLHPNAPMPEVHQSDSLLDDADGLRSRLGDEAFFAGLGSAGSSSGGGWGALDEGWDAVSYMAARTAAPGDPERGRLVSDFAGAYQSSFTGSADYVDLDHGLATVSAHAASLGYDVIVLFLDELVLWLASRISDAAFVASEGAKVAKLVESADASRPVPLVSFIARQRDLKDFLGEHVPGSEKLAFGDTFRWWEDRFNKITLEDRNLPVIVQRRLLRPIPGGDPAALSAAFQRLAADHKVWDVLLEGLDTDGKGGADRAAFAQTYPFSPALVSTLVVLSGMLQRERTALKVMQQILVDGRDELTVADLVPVGDLFDVLVGGGEVPLTDEIRHHFTNARTLYHEKLRPRLLERHRLDEDEAVGLDRAHLFRTDDRLVKTLLLSALAPKVPALQNLTAGKLAALNYGTIRTPIPGTEAVRVIDLFRTLAGDVGEVRLSDDPNNPLLTVELGQVDTDSVLERVQHVDTVGDRRRLLREMIFSSLGVAEQQTLTGVQHSFVWRGSRRIVDIIFGNVRDQSELPDESFVAASGRWKVIVDFPFDAEMRSPNDDHARVEALVAQRDLPTWTVCWIPMFFTEARMSDLGQLVCLDYVLHSTERFEANASHLSVQDRAQAKSILKNKQSALRQRLLGVVQQVYGASALVSGDVDRTHGEPRYLASLDASFSPGLPNGARLADAFVHLLDQMHTHTYPDHPQFEAEIKRTDLVKVLDHVQRAASTPGGRISVEQATRSTLSRICNRLAVGEMLESHYLLDPATFPWRDRFGQLAAQAGARGSLRVADLYAWIDQPRARGLDPLVRNLVVAAYALMTDRAWYLNGSSTPMPALERITADYELREPPKAAADDWISAVKRSARLFGVHVPELQTASNLATLAGDVRQAASRLSGPARDLVGALDEHAADLGLDTKASAGRLATARAAAALVERLSRPHDDLALVAVLAGLADPPAPEVLARSLSTSADVAAAIGAERWEVVRQLRGIANARPDAAALVNELQRAAGFDEHAQPLAPVLRSTFDRGLKIIVPDPPRPPTPSTVASRTVESSDVDSVLVELRTFAQTHAGERIVVTWDTVT